jgi:hypothetical protein
VAKDRNDVPPKRRFAISQYMATFTTAGSEPHSLQRVFTRSGAVTVLSLRLYELRNSGEELANTSVTSGGRSVGIVRKATELVCV